jgi:hypothetical protein
MHLYRILSACLAVAGWLAATSSALANLTFLPDATSNGIRFIMIVGQFETDDSLEPFAALVKSYNPVVIGFNSPGGNVAKAMELGRMIRSLGLNTFQARGPECASACALAFLGGVQRYAEPGAIGVHQSSFSDTSGMSVDTAVWAVQQMTAGVMVYMTEMGVDPALLQLALHYDSNDIRYLSASEMEQYHVTTDGIGGRFASRAPNDRAFPSLPAPPQSGPPQSSTTASLSPPDSRFTIPQPQSGMVRHPKGSAPLKALADGKSANLMVLTNGTPVTILGNENRWYRVSAGGQTGYMHHTWVWVAQYDSGPFAERHIQVKSFGNYADSTAYVRSTYNVPLSVYLATNGWFAITLKHTYSEAAARQVLKALKARKSVPEDAFITYGNTYVRKVCCD